MRRMRDGELPIGWRRSATIAAVASHPAFASTPVVAAAPAPSTAIAAGQLEALIGPLTESSTLKTGGGGGAFGGLRLAAQRLLFRVLRPLWFQQQQFHTQVIAALRLTAGALRAEEHARDVADARLRELTRRVLSARREVAEAGARRGSQRRVGTARAGDRGRADAPRGACALTGPRGGERTRARQVTRQIMPRPGVTRLAVRSRGARPAVPRVAADAPAASRRPERSLPSRGRATRRARACSGS